MLGLETELINYVGDFFGLEVIQLEKKSYNLVAWKIVCNNFEQEGLGIINLKLMNRALLWRYYNDNEKGL
jgi:hypothetical protein